MCLAKAYASKGVGTAILQDIKSVKVEGDSVVLDTIFGQRKTVKGKIAEIDFSASRIVIEEKGAPKIE